MTNPAIPQATWLCNRAGICQLKNGSRPTRSFGNRTRTANANKA